MKHRDDKQDQSGQAFTAEELARRCPAGWNVFEYRRDYAREGFEITKRLFAEIGREIGNRTIPYEELPLPCDMPIDVLGPDENGLLMIAATRDGEARIGTREDLEDEAGGPCVSGQRGPDLDRDYLQSHRPIAWHYRDMADVYASFGYGVALSAVEALRQEAKGAEVMLPARRTVRLTLGTTNLGGGCTMVCNPHGCVHHPNDSSNMPGG